MPLARGDLPWLEMRRQFFESVTRAGCRCRGSLKDVCAKADVKGASVVHGVEAIALCHHRSRHIASAHCLSGCLERIEGEIRLKTPQAGGVLPGPMEMNRHDSVSRSVANFADSPESVGRQAQTGAGSSCSRSLLARANRGVMNQVCCDDADLGIAVVA
jgi:hypothetical protein